MLHSTGKERGQMAQQQDDHVEIQQRLMDRAQWLDRRWKERPVPVNHL